MIILPILYRLYTSVIVPDPEISVPKVSCSTDMSPTTIYRSPVHRVQPACSHAGCREGVPGVWDRRVAGRAIPVPHPSTIPGPIFSIFLAIRPTHGQMKAILRFMMRFLR